MADLTKEDRINISLKLLGIDAEIEAAEKSLAETIVNLAIAQSKDDTNKKLSDERTVLINAYQSEAEYLDGITRTVLTESDFNDAARRKPGNGMYPADPNVPLPSIPDGIWKNFVPFSYTQIIGKNSLEVYPATGGRTEFDIITDLNAKIAQINSEAAPNRATGKLCTPGGFCTGGTGGANEIDCDAGGGVWTGGVDVYSADGTVTGLLDDLKTLVQEWEDMLNNEQPLIPTDDKNTTRNAGNQSSIADITAAIVVIDTWQTIQDFDTATPLPGGTDGSGCAIYDAMVEGQFQQAKIQPITLLPLQQELTARENFINVRAAELVGTNFLGSITQNLTDGLMSARSGLYGERALFVNMRLALMGGTLIAIAGLEVAEDIQEVTKENSENTEEALELAMNISTLTAPALNTYYLNLTDASGFSSGDRVYLVADEQEELSGSIEEVLGKRVKLTFKVPQKYTLDNNTRIYKVL